MGTRRTFTKEFKSEAIALVKQQGLSVNRVAKDLGVSWSRVNQWVEQHAVDSGDNPNGALTTAEKQELTVLRRENRTLKLERDILKKAAAFFAKESE